MTHAGAPGAPGRNPDLNLSTSVVKRGGAARPKFSSKLPGLLAQRLRRFVNPQQNELAIRASCCDEHPIAGEGH